MVKLGSGLPLPFHNPFFLLKEVAFLLSKRFPRPRFQGTWEFLFPPSLPEKTPRFFPIHDALVVHSNLELCPAPVFARHAHAPCLCPFSNYLPWSAALRHAFPARLFALPHSVISLIAASRPLRSLFLIFFRALSPSPALDLSPFPNGWC